MRHHFASSLLLASLAIAPARAQMRVAMAGDRPGRPINGEACAAPSSSGTRAATSVRMDTSIVYSVVGSRLLELDVARPRDLLRRPLVLMLYGTDRGTEMRAPIVALAKRGYVAASAGLRVESTTSDAAPLPQDGGLALRWLRSHADLLGIDVRRVMVLGESTPGDLSLLLGGTVTTAPVSPAPSVDEEDDCSARDDIRGRATTVLRGTRITAG